MLIGRAQGAMRRLIAFLTPTARSTARGDSDSSLRALHPRTGYCYVNILFYNSIYAVILRCLPPFRYVFVQWNCSFKDNAIFNDNITDEEFLVHLHVWQREALPIHGRTLCIYNIDRQHNFDLTTFHGGRAYIPCWCKVNYMILPIIIFCIKRHHRHRSCWCCFLYRTLPLVSVFTCSVYFYVCQLSQVI